MTDENLDRNEITIRADVYDRISQRVGESEFDTVDQYADFVLEELLDRLSEEHSKHDKENDEEVRDRLKELGYLE